MNLTRRQFGKTALAGSALTLIEGGTLLETGCPSQDTLAALVGVLGNAGATLATLEGDTALGTKLKADTAAAVAAISSWVSGTPAQDVLQVIAIVEDDFNLIPDIAPYAAEIALGLATIQSIISIITAEAPSTVSTFLSTPASVTLKASGYKGKVPGKRGLNSAWFRGEWNKIQAADKTGKLPRI